MVIAGGGILFDLPELEIPFKGRPKWKVNSWEPLDLSPSIQCSCGDHGFIKQGKWTK